MFEAVPSDVSLPALERDTLAFWEREKIFERSVESSEGRPPFVFYEGPPTANGIPHWGHVLTRVAKDVFLRYKSLTGFHVPRRAGWDTHGLPVEIEVEKELGLKGKGDIERYGIERFTRTCIDSVWRYIGEWERMSSRIGFWLDRDGYATYHRRYVESVWWALSEFFKSGLLYQGYKSVWWWPQGGTALSAGEVGEGYRPVDDPSIVVKFPVKGRPKTFLLAWTTTPWTLPSNTGLAVAAKEPYVEIRRDHETHIVAKALAGEGEVRREFLGEQLEGVRYEPLFRFRQPEGGDPWRVVAADFVTLDTGTGIVHMAPGFGEDDFRTAQQHDLGFLQLVEPDGTMSPDTGPFQGLYIKEADKPILRDLKERGLLLSHATVRHDYPFCPRAPDHPLIQYARRSWYIRTSTERDRVVANNARIRWQPEHIRDGRMGDFLRNNVDWAISRERWWGTPLPIWVNDATGRMEAVASVAEILERNPRAFDAFEAARRKDPSLPEDLRVHKPWIDEVTWRKPGEEGTYRRVPEVIDCWFDAGSMPFAQWGYPHENRERFERAFPAHFITEAIDQTRGWWNSLLQISTLLFPDAEAPHPFRSCVVLGHITDEQGRKLSKRLRNYEPPMEAMEQYGADAVRWALLSGGVPGVGTRFHGGAAKEATRDLLLKVWHVAAFLVTYARIDAWKPGGGGGTPAMLDRWILAELDQTVRDVRAAFDALESHTAARRVGAFVDGLSNWYLRRSRARFWASGESADKRAAFATLHTCLKDLAGLLAPFTPFFAELLHQRLVRAVSPKAPLSIHLAPFPEPDEGRRDDPLRARMGLARDLVALGKRVREGHNLKVRTPLRGAVVVLAAGDSIDGIEGAILDELNVKALEATSEPSRYVVFDVFPNFKALGPKLGKAMPLCKKALAEADGAALHAKLEGAGRFDLALPGGQAVTLTRDDVEIRLAAREGFAAASEGGRVVILDTRLDDGLRREGMAREVVHKIQTARKEMDLPYEARIAVTWQADGELARAIADHAAWIAGETLATRFEAGPAGDGAREGEVEGAPLRYAVVRA